MVTGISLRCQKEPAKEVNMCLNDGHFLLIQNDRETPLDDIAAILPLAGKLCLVDVLGKKREVVGCIQEIDLMNKRIVVG